jgi:hypothetical protein
MRLYIEFTLFIVFHKLLVEDIKSSTLTLCSTRGKKGEKIRKIKGTNLVLDTPQFDERNKKFSSPPPFYFFLLLNKWVCFLCVIE